MEDKPLREQNSGQILALLGKKSRGPLAKMRRNLTGELILMLVTYTPATLYYLFELDGKLSEIAWLLLLMMVFFAGYYYRKNKLLKKMLCVHCTVKSNLEQQVRTLQKYVRFYLVAGTLLIPVMIILCLAIVYRKLSLPPGSSIFFRMGGASWWKNIPGWVAVLGLLTIGVYFVNSWYVNKLYGRHIKKLQQLLKEMVSNE